MEGSSEIIGFCQISTLEEDGETQKLSQLHEIFPVSARAIIVR
jgi:hypothetical protein